MSGIVVLYRRMDSAFETNAIVVEVARKYGRGNVFYDIDTIPPGINFLEYITRGISQAALVVCVIGNNWFGISESGSRRIDSPQDFVLLELQVALKYRIPIIPVLVQGAQMPSSEQLPTSIASFAELNGISLHNMSDLTLLLMVIEDLAKIRHLFPSSTGAAEMPISAIPPIFWSRSSVDIDWCQCFADTINRLGCDVWVDSQINAGGTWITDLERQIISREVFMVIITPESWNSPWVQKEYELALRLTLSNNKRRLVPVILRETKLDGFIQTYQFLDVQMKSCTVAGQHVVSQLRLPIQF